MTTRGVVLAALGLALAAPAAATADNGFVEDVRVLHEWHGQPNGYFGWAVSELTDVDRDGVTDVITSEPYAGGGTTWVLSGRTGRVLHRFDGAPGDFQGAAVADAGDTDRDGVHDILSGATAVTGTGPGRAYLNSGRTGKLLHMWEGEHDLDRFGSAVSSAGDINLAGYDDVAVGAKLAGTVSIFSGRTHRLCAASSGRASSSARAWTGARACSRPS